MSPYHASKTMNTLTRLRRVPTSVSTDEDDRSTIQSTFEDKDLSFTRHRSGNQSDLYQPLAPDEADEEQLVEFFESLDFQVSFGDLSTPNTFSFDLDKVTQNTHNSYPTDTTLEHSSKRRRVASGEVSVSSYSSEETNGNYETARNFERKRSFSRVVSLDSWAPVE